MALQSFFFFLFYRDNLEYDGGRKLLYNMKNMLCHSFSTAKSCLCVCPVYHADQQHCMCTHDLVIEFSVSKAGKRLKVPHWKEKLGKENIFC